MGISKGTLKVLLREVQRRPFWGRVFTLGKQDIWFSYKFLKETAKEFGIELSKVDEITLSRVPYFADKRYISDICLFKSLGFSEVKSMDFSEFESADYIFDLNNGEIPEDLIEKFDVIIDGGTIEHVFHIPNALTNIHKMLREGGRIIHFSPSSNQIDHGFYMFSPTLFHDFYKTNNYDINNFQLFRFTPRHNVDKWEIYDYESGCLEQVSFGGLDDGMYGIICIVTKKKDSTGDRIPQQGVYLEHWGSWEKKEVHSKFQMLKDIISRYPFLYKKLRRFYRFILDSNKGRGKKGLGLKIVDRY